ARRPGTRKDPQSHRRRRRYTASLTRLPFHPFGEDPGLMTEKKHSFQQSLGLLDATMIVVGSMIGSGIFIVSADITRSVGSAGWLILVWVFTGILTIIAALSYGELSGMFPRAGGQYVYLKEAFNPLTGFLYGWSFFAVIQAGSIAAVGV